MAPSEEPRAHQCVGSTGRLSICFCNFHNMLNHATVCSLGMLTHLDTGQSEFVLTSLRVTVTRFSVVLMSKTF